MTTLLEYKKRNNTRRDEDKPELREAVDDIYRLLGMLETASIGQHSTSDVLGNPERGTSVRSQTESPSESESTLVTVDKAAKRAARKIERYLDYDAVAMATCADGKTPEQFIAEIIANELSVHQPDVQVVDEVSKEQQK